MILALILSGSLTVSEAVAGFGDPLVLLIAGLFVVGEGLVRTGVAYQVGVWLTRLAGASETRLLVLLMLAVAGLGAFMSSTGVVAIFIPVVLGITARLGIGPGRLMMPLAFAALLSGLLTLIATPPNLVINDALRGAGLQPFGFFGITPIGLLALALGIVYMMTLGRRLLPATPLQTGTAGRRQTLLELAESYNLTQQLHRLRLDSDSSLIGETVASAQLRTAMASPSSASGGRNALPKRCRRRWPIPNSTPADALYVVGPDEAATALCSTERLSRLLIAESQQRSLVNELGMVEVMLPPDSELIGQTLRQAAFRSHHGLSVLGIRRNRQPLPGNLIEEELAFGDILLVAGAWKRISLLQGEQNIFWCSVCRRS